jgi:hypothetical protein
MKSSLCTTDLKDLVKYLIVVSKIPLEKVMFFSVVAKPQSNHNFNKRILLFFVCTKKIRKKKKYGKPREVMFDKIRMNTKFFKKYYIRIN